MNIDTIHETHGIPVGSSTFDAARESQSIMNDEGDMMPFVPDIELEDLFPDTIPSFGPAPSELAASRDAEDEAADKHGSYALGRMAMGIPEPKDDVSVAALKQRLEEMSGVPMAPRGKSTGKYVHGPQLGEETARPVADQRVGREQEKLNSRNLREKIDPILARAAAKKLVRDAANLQIPESALTQKRK